MLLKVVENAHGKAGAMVAMRHTIPGVAFLVLGGVALLLHVAIRSALHTIRLVVCH